MELEWERVRQCMEGWGGRAQGFRGFSTAVKRGHLLPPSLQWLLQLLLRQSHHLKQREGPDEEEDNEGQSHTERGQQCSQQVELKSNRKNDGQHQLSDPFQETAAETKN